MQSASPVSNLGTRANVLRDSRIEDGKIFTTRADSDEEDIRDAVTTVLMGLATCAFTRWFTMVKAAIIAVFSAPCGRDLHYFKLEKDDICIVFLYLARVETLVA